MFTQHTTNARNLAAAAEAHGVTLPGDLPGKIAHAADLEAQARTARTLTPASIAADLVQHLGDPKSMTAARKAAALELAATEADQQVGAVLANTVASDLRSHMRRERDTIAAAFTEAARPHTDALAEHAGRLPEWFRPEQAGDLTPDLFANWRAVETAAAALEAMRTALSPCYGRADDDSFLTKDAHHALAYVKPPKRIDPPTAHRIARALDGQVVGGSQLGASHSVAVFAPTTLAHLGCTFEWATPTQAAERAANLTEAATEREPATV
ncbi:hypothetical protein ACTHQ1_05120 [Janibacter anophelis]|uniref:hypothetical protein n=1 Tax=Janibacter anophelis TaxID=319054 RepID=UPI003F8110F8